MDRHHDTFFAESLEGWRAWLEANHASTKAIWLILSKKNAARNSVSQTDAMEEALCFGWVDSLVRRVDEDSYMMKFTPRTNTGKWSAVNIARAKSLIASGRMREAGRVKIPDDILLDEIDQTRRGIK